MSRPRGDRITVTFRLPTELHRRLMEAAEDRDLSANWLASRALEDYLSRLLPVVKPKDTE